MRWYQDTKSITVSGDRKNEIEEKLIWLALVSEQVKNSNHEGEVVDDHYSEVLMLIKIRQMLINCP
jgi:hypothetical protein